MESLHELDTVALAQDLPEHHLVRGQVGAVVEVLDPQTVEVEFVDQHTGRTYALVVLDAGQLLRLHFAPLKAAS